MSSLDCYIMSHKNYWFKFVVSEEEDMKEIEEDFIKPFNIPPKRVLMMPGLDKQDNYHERTKFCMEMGKKYGYTGLTRLHVSAWDQTTGVWENLYTMGWVSIFMWYYMQ